jgi:hypothetical protein
MDIQTFQKEVTLILYKIQAFNQNEILAMIDNETLNKIKQTDPHPFFQVYSICHDGVSNPKLLGDTDNKPISWSRRAVQSLKNIVLKGIKFFRGHNADNSVENRDPIGEIVANKEIEIDGKLNHIAIAYHRPEVVKEVKEYDICSQEGIWNFIESAGSLLADSVERITGIALGNSKTESPAFSGAKRLGMVQAFETTGEVGENKTGGEPANNGGKPKEKIMDLKLKDVIDFIEENKVHPTQLKFKIEDLRNDRNLNTYFENLENKVTEAEKKLKTFEDDKNKWILEKNKLQESINEYVSKENHATVSTRFIDYVDKQKNLTNAQKQFIKAEFEWKKPESMTDEEITQFVEDIGTKKFKVIVPKISIDSVPIEQNVQTPQVEAADPGDFNNPANNDLLADSE